MIVLQNDTESAKKQRVFASGVTIVCTLLLGVILVFAAVPEMEAVYRNIDDVLLNRLLFSPVTPPAEPELATEAAESTPTEPRNVVEPSRIPERIQLGDMLPKRAPVLAVSNNNRAPATTQTATTNQSITIQRQSPERVGGLTTLTGLNRNRLPQGNNRSAGGQAGNGRIALSSGSSDGGGGSQLSGTSNLPGLPTGTGSAPQAHAGNGEAEELDIMLRELGDLGEGFASAEFNALAEWLRANERDFANPVKLLMAGRNWQDNFLHSWISFNAGGKSYELYLMCKEELYEVHIVLVENNDATYLVDRNLSGQSTQLRTGPVKRATSGQIALIDTRMGAPSDQRSKQFYQIFQSWWESVKDN